MNDLDNAVVRPEPFPHAVIDGLFDAATFGRLAASYPLCPPASGPTGHTIHRGDVEFDALMAANADWREFFGHTNSEAFVAAIARLFEAEMARSASVEPESLRFADHVEDRIEKEQGALLPGGLKAEDIHIRFDFMQGREAYRRAPHLDHRRRLATMLVYFEAPGEESFTGGDLVLHDAEGVEQVRIAPAPNRAVLFPCSDRSWHSVEAVENCKRPRNLIQVAATSRHDIWPGARLPGADPLWRRAARRLLAKA